MTSDLPSGPVVLDACVLFRGRLSDALLHLAEAGLFEPVWSAEIEAEWMRGLRRRRGIPAAVVAERHGLLRRAFPAAACDPDPALIAAILALCRSAAQRKDAHVIAAAVAAEARWIVTENTADFPRRVLERHGLRALRPDAFCAALLAADPDSVVAGLRSHRAGLREPTCDAVGYLALLAGRTMSLPQTARRLAAEAGRL
jgi:hypothetical protein